ncbi:hypothetical protein [Nocardioides sp. HB32]
MRTFIKIPHAAELAGCTPGTVYNRIKSGDLAAYKLPNRREHVVEKEEALSVLTKRQRYGSFGPDAVVHDLSNVVGVDFVVEES